MKKIILLPAVLILIGLAGFLFFKNKSEPFKIFLGVKDFQETKLAVRAIDGILVAQGQDKIFPYAVIIENHFEARPQSGLNAGQFGL